MTAKSNETTRLQDLELLEGLKVLYPQFLREPMSAAPKEFQIVKCVDFLILE